MKKKNKTNPTVELFQGRFLLFYAVFQKIMVPEINSFVEFHIATLR